MEATRSNPSELAAASPAKGWRQCRLRHTENSVLVVSLTAKVLLRLAGTILRKLFNTGIAA